MNDFTLPAVENEVLYGIYDRSHEAMLTVCHSSWANDEYEFSNDPDEHEWSHHDLEHVKAIVKRGQHLLGTQFGRPSMSLSMSLHDLVVIRIERTSIVTLAA